jgi:2-polyprenyl-6-methoxyphenol hydroxylase-like FAD-dependent oxidoreductase
MADRSIVIVGAGPVGLVNALALARQGAVETMRAGRVLFAGDAAHITNPTNGFGLVGGLYDSYVLGTRWAPSSAAKSPIPCSTGTAKTV